MVGKLKENNLKKIKKEKNMNSARNFIPKSRAEAVADKSKTVALKKRADKKDKLKKDKFKRISFDKGKNFYTPDPTNTEQMVEIMNKLNKKTWYSVVGKMKDSCLMKMATETTAEVYFTGVEVQPEFWNKKKVDLLNSLLNYLAVADEDIVV